MGGEITGRRTMNISLKCSCGAEARFEAFRVEENRIVPCVLAWENIHAKCCVVEQPKIDSPFTRGPTAEECDQALKYFQSQPVSGAARSWLYAWKKVVGK